MLELLSILSLFFLPLFLYIDHEEDIGADKNPMTIGLLFINYVFNLLYLGELVSKIYAFGIRRTFRYSDWVIKLEFPFQIICIINFFVFLFDWIARVDNYAYLISV